MYSYREIISPVLFFIFFLKINNVDPNTTDAKAIIKMNIT